MTETGTRAPAPGSLAIVQKFINSTEMPDGVDELRTAQLASGWLHDTIGVDLTVSEKDRQRLIATREAMRDLLEAHTGENVDPAVAVRLERLLGRAPLRPVLSAQGATLTVNCRGIDSFLGMLSTAIVEATLLGTWPRLKVCRGRLLPLGVLRPFQERPQLLVLDAQLRFSREGTDIPSQTAGGVGDASVR